MTRPAESTHAERARDVFASLFRLAAVHAAAKDTKSACAAATEARSIITVLADKAPEMHRLQQDRRFIEEMIAALGCE